MQALAPQCAVGGPTETMLRGTPLSLAAIVGEALPNAGEQDVRVWAQVFSARAHGMTPDGVLRLRGGLDDLARHLIHAAVDPRWSGNPVLSAAPPQGGVP